MKNFIISVFFLTSFYASSQECSYFYLIRHAEKLRIDKTERNPKLNEKGVLRAEKWKEILKNINLDKIYSTNYNRTIETANPTSKLQNIDIIIYSPSNSDYKNFKEINKGKKVLIVGHSNTIPNFVNGLIEKDFYDQIDDLNNSNLYLVNICGDKVSHHLLFIE
ncbi:MAG: histidine phosphatase family protein [Flavobacteriaceae bacterium]|nr:histidine phosphatase family protein [Flavobacteriaceae bacterium]MBL6680628.1 histidine phosphatase family protein [Flavobacteriaceae bacterium]